MFQGIINNAKAAAGSMVSKYATEPQSRSLSSSLSVLPLLLSRSCWSSDLAIRTRP